MRLVKAGNLMINLDNVTYIEDCGDYEKIRLFFSYQESDDYANWITLKGEEVIEFFTNLDILQAKEDKK